MVQLKEINMKRLTILMLSLLATAAGYGQCNFSADDIGVNVSAPTHCNSHDGVVTIDLPDSQGTCFDVSTVTAPYNCSDNFDHTFENSGIYYVNNGDVALVKGPFDGQVIINSGVLVVCGQVRINNQLNLTGNDQLIVLDGAELEIAAIHLESTNARFENYGTCALYYESSSSFGNINVNTGSVFNYGNLSSALDISLNQSGAFLENYANLTIGTEVSQQGHRQQNVRGNLKNYGTLTCGLNVMVDYGGQLQNFCQLICNRKLELPNATLFENFGSIVVADELYSWSNVTVGGGSYMEAASLRLKNTTITNNDADCAQLKGTSMIGVYVENGGSVNLNGDISLCGNISEGAGIANFSAGAGNNCVCTADGSGSYQSTTYTLTWPVSTGGGNQTTRNDLDPGDYVVTVSDGSCDIDITINVPEPDGFDINYQVSGESCEQPPLGDLSLSVSGNYTEPVTYLINGPNGTINQGDPIVPGTYTVTATDANGCTSTETIVVDPDDLSFDLDIDVFVTPPTTCGGSDGTVVINFNNDDNNNGGGSYQCFDASAVKPPYTCNPDNYDFKIDGGGRHEVLSGQEAIVMDGFTGDVFVHAGATLVTCGTVELMEQITLEANAKLVNLGDLSVTAIVLNEESSELLNYGNLYVTYNDVSSSHGSLQITNGFVQNYGTMDIPLDLSLNASTSILHNYGDILVGSFNPPSGHLQLNVNGELSNYGQITIIKELQVNPGGRLYNYCQMEVFYKSYLTDQQDFANYGHMLFHDEFYFRNGVLTLGSGSSIVAEFLKIENATASNSETDCALLKGISTVEVFRANAYTGPISISGAISVCSEGSYGGDFHELTFLNGATQGCDCSVKQKKPLPVENFCEAVWVNDDQSTTVSNTRDDLAAGTYTVTINCDNGCSKTLTIVVPPSNAGGPQVQVSTLPTEVGLCEGQLDLTQLTGGTAPFSFILKSNNFQGQYQQSDFPVEGLCAGTYTLCVSDAKGCKFDTIVTIFDWVDSLCQDFGAYIEPVSPGTGNCDASLHVIVSGGSGDYLISWQDAAGNDLGSDMTINGVCENQRYYVHVTDRYYGCTLLDDYQITGPPPCGKDLSITSTNVSCHGFNDGTITLNIDGGLGSTPGSCSSQASSGHDCGSCNNEISGSISYAINDYLTHCVPAGSTISGNLHIENGTVVICGQTNNLYVTLGANGVLVNNGNNSIQQVNANGTNAHLINNGTLTISNLNTTVNNFDNYGTFISDNCYLLNTGTWNNYGTYTINNSFNVQGNFTNYGQVTVQTWDQNNSQYGHTYNYCELTVNNAFYLSRPFENHGTLKVLSNNAHINSNSQFTTHDGSRTEFAALNLYASITNQGAVSAIQAGNVNGSGNLSGELQVCGNWNSIGLGSQVTHVGSCDNISLGCTLSWYLGPVSNGVLIGEGEQLTDLAPGVYTYVLNCGACEASGEVTIAEPEPLSVSIQTINQPDCPVKCNGVLQANVQGGTTPYFIEWDAGDVGPLMTEACPESHMVKVSDARNCVASDGLALEALGVCPECPADGFDLGLSATNASTIDAHDGTVTVVPEGGIPQYKYIWNNNFNLNTASLNGVAPGWYVVEVTDAGLCLSVDSVQVGYDNGGEPCLGFELSLELTANASCIAKADGEITATISGATNPIFQWFYRQHELQDVDGPLYENAAAGHYRVIVTEGPCRDEATVYLGFDDEDCPCIIDLDAEQTKAANCKDESNGAAELSVENGTGTYQYVWTGPQAITNTQVSPLAQLSLSNLLPGDYETYVTDKDACVAYDDLIIEGFDKPCQECEDFTIELKLEKATNNLTCNATAEVIVHDDGQTPFTYIVRWSTDAVGFYTADGTGINKITRQCHGDYWVKVTLYHEGELVCEMDVDFELLYNDDETPTSCDDYDPLVVTYTIDPQPINQVIAGMSLIDLHVSGGVGNYDYQWHEAGWDGQDLSTQLPGTYTVTVTSDTCFSETITIQLIACEDDPDCPDDQCDKPCPDCDDPSCGDPCLDNPGSCDDYDYFVTHATCEDPFGSVNLVVRAFGIGGPYHYYWYSQSDPSTDLNTTAQDLSNQAPGLYSVVISDNAGNQLTINNIEIRNVDPQPCSNPPLPLAVDLFIVDDLDCEEDQTGVIGLELRGGVAPYTYAWRKDGVPLNRHTQDIDLLGPGLYQVTVTDALGAVVTAEKELIAPANVACPCEPCILILAYGPTGCPDDPPSGWAHASIQGGVAPVLFWSTGDNGSSIRNLDVGDYTAMAGDSLCDECKPDPKPFSIEAVYDPATCDKCGDFDPQITFTPGNNCNLSGSVLSVSPAAYSYKWSTGAFTRSIPVSTPGVYTVVVQKAYGCESITLSYTVEDTGDDIIGINTGITANQPYLCYNGTITLQAPFIANAAYQWYPQGPNDNLATYTVSEPGLYYVEITVGNCVYLSTHYTVTGAPGPDDLAILGATELCAGTADALLLTSNVSLGNMWYYNGDLIGSTQQIQANEPGTYRLDVTYPGCTMVSITKEIEEKTDCESDDCRNWAVLAYVDTNDIIDCKTYLINQAEYNAEDKYRKYLDGLRTDFQQGYIAHCLKVQESMTMKNSEGEQTHHYTLYYYDQAGNLVRTVPPEGVVLEMDDDGQADEFLAKIADDRVNGVRSNFTKHRYATTYTYNSLNQLISQDVPDHDLMKRFVRGNRQFSDATVDWNTAALAPSGSGVLLGTDADGNAVIYYTNNGGGDWEPLSSIGLGQLSTTTVAVDAAGNVQRYAAGANGTIVNIDAANQATVYSVGSNYAVEFLNFYQGSNSEGVAVTLDREVFKTTDAGVSWNSLGYLNLDEIVGQVVSVYFVSDDVVLLGSDQGIFSSVDGGHSWTEHTAQEQDSPLWAATLSGNTRFYGGENGTIYKTANDLLVPVTIGDNTYDVTQMQAAAGHVYAQVNDSEEWWGASAQASGLNQLTASYTGIVPVSNGEYALAWRGNQVWRLSGNERVGSAITLEISDAIGMTAIDDAHFVYWDQDRIYFYNEGNTSSKSMELSVSAPKSVKGTQLLLNANRYQLFIPITQAWYFLDNLEDPAVTNIDTDAGLPSVRPSEYLNANESVNQVTFTDANNGFVVSNVNIYYTANAGQSWQVYAAMPTGITLNEVLFTAAGIRGMGDDGRVYLLNAGTWNPEAIELQLPVGINDMYVLKSATENAYTLAAAADLGRTVIMNYDGTGHATNIAHTGSTNDIIQITIGEDGNAQTDLYALDAAGQLYQNDNAAGWQANPATALTLTATSTLAADNDGEIQVGTTGVTRYDDNGAAGTVHANNQSILDLDYASNSNGEGLLYLYEGNELWTANDFDGGSVDAVAAFEVPSLQDVTINAAGVGYAVGVKGTIIKTTDGGNTWQLQSSGSDQDFHAVDMFDTNRAIAVGNGIAYNTVNGGASWQPVTSALIQTGTVLNDVAFRTSGEAYAVGDNDVFLNINITANGNTTVSNTFSVSGNLKAITFVDNKVGYACGDNDLLVKYDDTDAMQPGWRLIAWQGEVSGDWNSLEFIDREVGYITGSSAGNGVLLKTLTGGVSWGRSEDGGIVTNGEPVIGISMQDRSHGVLLTADQLQEFDDMQDRFSGLFWYDELGRLVLSQNTKQFNKYSDGTQAYSYTQYDELGRIVEVGEVRTFVEPVGLGEESGQNTSFNIDEGYLRYVVNSGERTEVTHTYYDTVHAHMQVVGDYYEGIGQPVAFNNSTLRNRVAATTYTDTLPAFIDFFYDPLGQQAYDYATLYSYDIHGNVKTLIQENPELDNYPTIANSADKQIYKRVDYDYDLVSGNVNEVAYQRGFKDQFFHRYSYDADNRIEQVETSADGVLWEHQATYDYYRHGPLMRSVCGDQQIQGCDYAYTLQGWLKTMNSNGLNGTDDIGDDGNNGVLKDEFGFELGYYQDDYKAIDATLNRSTLDASFYDADKTNADKSQELFNGNISSRMTAIAHFMTSSNSTPSIYGYKYDQLNRLKSADSYKAGTGSGQVTASINKGVGQEASGYHVDLSYDANGNIESLNRYASKTQMDQFTYHYDAPDDLGTNRYTNRLLQVEDGITTTADSSFGDLQHGQQADNYDYDGIGNLVKDRQEEIDTILWTVYGKVWKVYREPGSSKPNLVFVYDAAGNRVMKKVLHANSADTTITHYIRDASGNCMGIYKEHRGTDDTLQLVEHAIYGSSRLGLNTTIVDLSDGAEDNDPVVALDYGTRQYELSDHLGNVSVVLSGTRLPNTGNTNFTADVLSANEYYPFGMIMPNRNFSSESYRYGFNGQEKDDEVNGTSGTSYTAMYWQYDSRLGRRWNLDPVVKHHESNYLTFGGNPILFVDPFGDDKKLFNQTTGEAIDHEEDSEEKTAIYVVDTKSEDYDIANPWKTAVPLTYSVGNKDDKEEGKPAGVTGNSFRENHPLYSKRQEKTGQFAAPVGGQVYEEDLLDMTFEFNELVTNGMSDFKDIRYDYFKKWSFRNLVTDDAPYDLKSLVTNDGTPSYAAIVIGEWSMYEGRLMRYDDYGNTSFGIFGLHAHFSKSTLLEGSDWNQKGKDISGKTSGDGDEPRDVYFMKLGFELYEQYFKYGE